MRCGSRHTTDQTVPVEDFEFRIDVKARLDLPSVEPTLCWYQRKTEGRLEPDAWLVWTREPATPCTVLDWRRHCEIPQCGLPYPPRRLCGSRTQLRERERVGEWERQERERNREVS